MTAEDPAEGRHTRDRAGGARDGRPAAAASRAPVYWLRQTLADVPAHDDWLGAEERADLERLRVPKRRADWRLGRWAAHRLLGVSPLTGGLAGLRVSAARDGAPEAFAGASRAPCVLSISHSCGVGVCAVAPDGASVGVDVERVETRSAEFVGDYFTAREASRVRAAPPTRRDLLATLVWSAKESAAKALREGLRLDTRSLDVCFPRGGGSGWRRLAVVHRPARRVFRGWWREEDGFVVTLVARPGPARPVALGPGVRRGERFRP